MRRCPSAPRVRQTLDSDSTILWQARYRYYTCCAAQKRGWGSCSTKSVPATEMETFVVSQIRGLTSDRRFVAETVSAFAAKQRAQIATLQGERKSLELDLDLWQTEINRVLEAGESGELMAERLAAYETRLRQTERTLADLTHQQTSLLASSDVNTLEKALHDFDPVWNAMPGRHQKRVLQLLIRQIDYDGATGKIAITFHQHGFEALADNLRQRDNTQ